MTTEHVDLNLFIVDRLDAAYPPSVLRVHHFVADFLKLLRDFAAEENAKRSTVERGGQRNQEETTNLKKTNERSKQPANK